MRSDATMKPHAEPDPDVPLTDDEFERGHGAVLARRARAATQLSQGAFSTRYGIPLGCLRDWEQGRSAPDQSARSYLRIIAAMPDKTAEVLRATA